MPTKKNAEKTGKERRKSQRISLPIEVKCKYIKKRNVLLEQIFTESISGGGVGLRLGQPLTKGTRIKTLLYLPGDSRPVTAISEVTWCKQKGTKKQAYYDAGIRYVKMAPKDRERFVFLFCELLINFFMGGGSHVSGS